jgi:zinc transport system permease protein
MQIMRVKKVMHVIETLFDTFSYAFMQRALIVGVLVAISASLIGSFLVLKNFSMIGHGLSHVSFGAVAIALVLDQQPTFVTLPIVILAAILILKVNERATIHGDAAIGLLATLSIAFGTVIASLNGGFNVDLYSYLFGSILTVTTANLIAAIIISIIIIITVVILYNDLFAVTYDEEFAKISGIKTKYLNYVLAILTAITITIGIRVIGTMLISSLIIFPMITAMQFKTSFKTTLIVGSIISVVNVVIGLVVSVWYNIPSGSTIVLFSGFVFLSVYLYNKIRST